MNFLSHLRRSFATRLAEHRTYYELARLADRERADIGLEGGDLRFVARAAARLQARSPADSESPRAEPFGKTMASQGLDSDRFDIAPASTRSADGRFRTWSSTASLLSDLASRMRQATHEEIRYRRAMRELRRLDDRDLDDLAIGRADLPGMARRHALT
jgi:uncharacterized protein YjiS (DUF1127 family)